MVGVAVAWLAEVVVVELAAQVLLVVRSLLQSVVLLAALWKKKSGWCSVTNLG